MPPGEHSICATVNGKPGKRTVMVDREACERLQADLEEQLRASAAGEQARPMLMFDHKAGNAAARPLGFEWDAERGVLLRVEWTQAGREAVEGGNYGYVSPAFRLARGTGQILGLSGGVEVGSLVNDPAFQRNECIAAAREDEPEEVQVDFVETSMSVPPRAEVEKNEFARDNETVANGGGENSKKKMETEAIKNALGLAPDADDAAVLSAIKALKTQGAEAKTRTEQIEAECEQHKNALKEHKEKSADAFVKRLNKGGIIGPHDEEKAKAARTLFLADPEQAETLFAGMRTVQTEVLSDKVHANRVPSSREMSAAEILQADFEANN